jgi:hypothetical protein
VTIDGQTHYLLALNKNARESGKYKLAPLGGAVGNIWPEGLSFLEERGVVRDDFEGVQKAVKKARQRAERAGATFDADAQEDVANAAERDLRFTLARDQLPAYITWFMSRRDRETDTWRELGEELVDEQEVLSVAEWTWLSGQFAFDWHDSEDALYQDLRAACVHANGSEAGELLDTAYALARTHHDQADNRIRDDGRHYILHPLEIAYHYVVGLGRTDLVGTFAALFHDLLEDTEAQPDEIHAQLGADRIKREDFDRVVAIVDNLGERAELRSSQGRLVMKMEHINRVEASGDATSIIIKTIDRLHNILTGESPKSARFRLMAVAEINRWRGFLDNPAIPADLREQIGQALDREWQRRLSRDTAAQTDGRVSTEPSAEPLRLGQLVAIADAARSALELASFPPAERTERRPVLEQEYGLAIRHNSAPDSRMPYIVIPVYITVSAEEQAEQLASFRATATQS